jgi:hypothetical protein
MRGTGNAGATFLCSAGFAGADRTHRRELLLAGGPEKQAVPGKAGTRWRHFAGSGLAFDARGIGHCVATVRDDDPQSIEAGPSPDTRRANGGRCCPHSKNPFGCDPGLARNRKTKFHSGAFRRSENVTRRWRLDQLTKRRSRTFITRPIARKTNNVAEPP